MNPNTRQLMAALELLRAGRRDQAIGLLRRVCLKDLRDAEAASLLGVALVEGGEAAQGEFHIRRAVSLAPSRADFRINLANVLHDRWKPEEARAEYARATELEPGDPAGWLGLSRVAFINKRFDEASRFAARALELGPEQADAIMNAASALLAGGRVEDSILAMRGWLDRNGPHPAVLSQLAGASNYSDRLTPREVFALHQRYGELFSGAKRQPARTRRCGERVRVGFLSADFFTHSVSFFLSPLWSAIDRTRFEVVAIDTGSKPDQTTARLRLMCDRWEDTRSLDDAALAERLRALTLDVLLDLGGHSFPTRLGALAARPCPVQINWLGYPNTTGVAAMNARLVDATTDPVGEGDSLAVERLVRLAPCFLCYQPPDDLPACRPGPSLRGEEPVFGSFNALAKLSDRTLDLWARLLVRVRDARLVIKAPALADPESAARLLGRLAARGVPASRLEVLPGTATIDEHLAMYARMDVALDPFPYNGTTTTLEALVMGVPVVSLVGDRHASRVGAAILGTLGEPGWACRDEQAYLDVAAELIRNSQRLQECRNGLRSRVLGGRLGDATAFARSFEDALNDLLGER